VYEKNTVQCYDSLRFISGTTKIACSVVGGMVEIWELEGNSMRRCESYNNAIIRSDGASLVEQDISFMSPDSRLIVLIDGGDVKVRRNEPEVLQQEDTDIFYDFKDLLTSPDGRLIASIDSQKLRLWNSTTKEQLWEFAVVPEWTPERGYRNILKFSDDSQIFALAGWNSEPVIWQAQSGRRCAKLPAHGICPSLSGNSMMAASTVGSIIDIWVLKPAQKLLCTYAGHDGEVSNVVFSNDDSQTVASSSDDGVVMVWSLQSGKCMHRWHSGGTNVLGLAFSHESELIASCAGRYVRVWSVKSGKRLVTFNLPRGYAWFHRLDSIHFSPDAKFVVMAGKTDDIGIEKYFTILGVDSGEVHRERVHFTTGAVRSFQRSEDGTLYILTEFGDIAVLDSRPESPSEILEEADRVTERPVRLVEKMKGLKEKFDPAETDEETDGETDGETDEETDGETGRVDVQLIGYGLSADGSWVEWNGMQLIWLPKRYRKSKIIVHGSTIILGLVSERLCLMRLSYGDLSTTGLSPAQLMEEPNTSRGCERAEAKTKSGTGPAASRIDLAAPF
jgi:WD40 repeat protein